MSDSLTARRSARPLAPGAPHVRAAVDLRSLTGAFLVALLPCAAFGVYNTGYQANRALAALGEEHVAGWRGEVLDVLGVGVGAGSVLACVVHGALFLLPLFVTILVVGGFWERLFARVRVRALQPGLMLFALLFTLGLPPTFPLWQAALGASFGLVVGREVFGGMGRYVVHPVLVGLAFLVVTYPGGMRGDTVWVPVDGAVVESALGLASAGGLDALRAGGVTWLDTFLGRIPGASGGTSAAACLFGAVLLLVARAASWRILAGILVGAVVTASLFRWSASPVLPAATIPWTWHLTLGSFAFATVFLATDPVTAATTQAGRFLYGLLIGFLIIVIRVASPVHPEGTTLAILLGNVFAPLIDHAVVRAHVGRRSRRRRARGGAS